MVPVEVPLPSLDHIFSSQEKISVKMAGQLESLVHHYNNMDNALHEFESGEEFSEEDMQGDVTCLVPSKYTGELTREVILGMNGDANALPVIVTELEDGVKSIEKSQLVLFIVDLQDHRLLRHPFSEQLISAKNLAQEHLEIHRHTLTDLDDLGEIMTAMIERQQSVEVRLLDPQALSLVLIADNSP